MMESNCIPTTTTPTATADNGGGREGKDATTAAQHVQGRSKYAAPAEWEAHRPTIRRLYLDENRKLGEVQIIMERDHGFHASLNMYKKRIRTWRLNKNLNAEDCVEIFRERVDQVQKRGGGGGGGGDDGNGKMLSVRGRPLGERKFWRYLNRRPDVLAKLAAAAEAAGGSPPRTIARPLSPANRDFYRRIEISLSAVRDYVSGARVVAPPSRLSSGSGLGSTYKPVFQLPGEAGLSLDLDVQLMYLRNRFVVAADVMNASADATALQSLDGAFGDIQWLLGTGKPEMIALMLQLSHELREKKGRPELAALLDRHILDMARVLLGDSHPITTVWNQLVGIMAESQADGGGEKKTALDQVVATLLAASSEYSIRRSGREIAVYTLKFLELQVPDTTVATGRDSDQHSPTGKEMRTAKTLRAQRLLVPHFTWIDNFFRLQDHGAAPRGVVPSPLEPLLELWKQGRIYEMVMMMCDRSAQFEGEVIIWQYLLAVTGLDKKGRIRNHDHMRDEGLWIDSTVAKKENDGGDSDNNDDDDDDDDDDNILDWDIDEYVLANWHFHRIAKSSGYNGDRVYRDIALSCLETVAQLKAARDARLATETVLAMPGTGPGLDFELLDEESPGTTSSDACTMGSCIEDREGIEISEMLFDIPRR